jgi:hypothetical protein
MELLAVPPAAEVARQLDTGGELSLTTQRGLLTIAKTVLGSVKICSGSCSARWPGACSRPSTRCSRSLSADGSPYSRSAGGA